MNSVKIVFATLALTFLLVTPAISETQKEKDFAVPAFSDAPLLGVQNTTAQLFTQKQLSPLTYSRHMQWQWMDINRDLQLNDFDVKQFQAIIENLHGQKLTGLQLIIWFQEAQKNQGG